MPHLSVPSEQLDVAPHFILVDREWSASLAVRYPSRAVAEDAMEHSEFIDELCERDCLDLTDSATATLGYTLVYPPEFPDPEPSALKEISDRVLEQLGDAQLTASVGPGDFLYVEHAGQAQAFFLHGRTPGRTPPWVWSMGLTSTTSYEREGGHGDLEDAEHALSSWATHQVEAQRLRDLNARFQAPGPGRAPPSPSTSAGPAL